ncbi:MAG: glycine--tRNA ligase [Tissierellia bacterium]|nr:glycine--tRNA ligase [Tissierellia bacterium]
MISMESLVSLAKNRGFVYPGSEIYGGLSNTWDYGPLGVELKKNIKNSWWYYFVQRHMNVVGLDASILMNPAVWEASGHVGGFSDPLIDCKECKSRFRADHIVEDYLLKNNIQKDLLGADDQKLHQVILEDQIPCPVCGKHNFTNIRKFNLMFKTHQGVTEEATTEIYLRPETAQGIFVDFKSVQRSSRMMVPFGIGQIGKSFRNEITPGNFIFRTREFEQMEMQFFCKPGTDLEWYDYWKKHCWNFLLDLGLTEENIRFRDHEKEELSHYSVATTDIEYLYPFGWGELWGVADRTDYDLSQHMKHSGKDMQYLDPQTNEKYTPFVIEPSVGVERLFLAFLVDAYDEETLEDGSTRNLLRFHPMLAPVKISILPLSKKLSPKAEELYHMLSRKYNVEFDERGSIGRRYRRSDEIGTPYCVTVDFQSLEDNTVTIRDRDTMEQERVDIEELMNYFEPRFQYE